MQKIVTSLWFNHNAEEAIDFYISIFKDGKIKRKAYYTENSPGKAGSVVSVDFQLFGQDFLAINAGPQFPFTNAISFTVNCDDQKEIDRLWEALLADGGKEQQCGWLTDKFGLSWQIVPRQLSEMIAGKTTKKSYAAFQAMMKMIKLDIAELQKAYDSAD